MEWDASTPQDSDLFSVVAPSIHEAKEMIRERAVAFNGTFDEHHDNESDDFGKHVPSKVPWVKWHDNYSDLESFCSPASDFEGTLHFDLDEEILYSVRNGTITAITIKDHNDLNRDGYASDHPQYIKEEKLDDSTGDPEPYEESGIELNASSLTVNTQGDLIPESHTTQSFEDAHGELLSSESDVQEGTALLTTSSQSAPFHEYTEISTFDFGEQERAFYRTATEELNMRQGLLYYDGDVKVRRIG